MNKKGFTLIELIGVITLLAVVALISVPIINNTITKTKLKGYKVKHIQPTPHWLFNDRLLSEIYDETYPFEEE